LPPARTQIIRKWTIEELAAALQKSKSDGDVARGKRLFSEARCIVCHRAGESGGVSGPDLTAVGSRFSPVDILKSIIEPSRIVDEKYMAVTLELADGRLITGRIAPGDYRAAELELVPNLLEPQKTVEILKKEIVRRDTSPVSPMPQGLLDFFQQAEIIDLLAFLSAASSRSPSE
jgi:putative heme-binding domain-containing protein